MSKNKILNRKFHYDLGDDLTIMITPKQKTNRWFRWRELFPASNLNNYVLSTHKTLVHRDYTE